MKLFAMLVCTSFALIPASARSHCPTDLCDPGATKILVRKDCTGLQNCFESVAELSGKSHRLCRDLVEDQALGFGKIRDDGLAGNVHDCSTNGWLWTVSASVQAGAHVFVDIGPDTFEPFVCPRDPAGANGHVTVRGVNRSDTILLGSDDGPTVGDDNDPLNPDPGEMGIEAFGCEDLVFADLRAEGASYGARWQHGGEATWVRVDMVARPDLPGAFSGNNTLAGWGDGCRPPFNSELSVHRMLDVNSLVAGTPAQPQHYAGYISDCAVTHYFGGSMGVSIREGSGGARLRAGLALGGQPGQGSSSPPVFHGFDTEIFVSVDEAASGIVVGAFAAGSSTITLQDSSLRIDAPGAPSGTIGNVIRRDTPIELPAGSPE